MTTNDASDTAPTPPATTACTVIGSYKIPTGETCTLLAFCKPGEPQVGGRTMLARGEEAKASMEEADFQNFWKYRNSVPSKFSDRYHFAFPKASDAYGNVRYANLGVIFWSHDRLSLDNDWNDCCVLVRFRRKRS